MANVVKYILELEDKASAGLNKGADAADRYDAELKDVDKTQKSAQVSATAVAAGVTIRAGQVYLKPVALIWHLIANELQPSGKE